jgi:mRNA-degrading endonuclease RelE of RelBE toxin-antitoxin system
MNWRVIIRSEVEQTVAQTAAWYESRQPHLGTEFVEEVIRFWHTLAKNPLLNSRRHPYKNIRWRYLDRFPYRVIYEADQMQQTVLVAAVLHAARQSGRGG